MRSASTTAAKPVFLKKAQREQLAAEEKQQEADAARQRVEEEARQRREFEQRAVSELRRRQEEERHVRDGRYRRDARQRPRPDETDVRDSKHSKPETAVEYATHITPSELSAIKASFLGAGDERVRKIRKSNDRKVTFDWDASEDTSVDRFGLAPPSTLKTAFGGHTVFDDDIERLPGRRSGNTGRADGKKDSSRRGGGADDAMDDKHWTEKSLADMRERDWRIMREDFRISTRGGKIPNPIRSWVEAGLPPRILEVITDVGYTDPTPIQRQAIPIGLQNRDIVGIAETGSGKTAAFVIPMIMYISELPPLTPENATMGPYALILAPTRELALQIDQETRRFADRIGYRCVSIIGGHSLAEQSFHMHQGAHVIVATPGRLVDCLERRILVLDQCAYLVLDEADKMIDMGFEVALNTILEALPVTNLKPEDEIESVEMATATATTRKYRQTVMFSATMPPALERIARKYLRKPVSVTIGSAGEAVGSVTQIVEMIHEERRRQQRLEQILSEYKYQPPIIVFVNQKASVDALARSLGKLGFKTTTLHGGKSQDQREHALAQIKRGEADILVATDVAGRGIDVKDVSLVVNFDMAKNIEDYTHRIGRTGRAGKAGTAITFLTNADTEVMYDLRKMLQRSGYAIPPELEKHEAAQAKPGTVKTKRKHEETLYQ